MKQKNILFIVPYPRGRAPSQRFRVELYEPVLRAHEVRYEIASFMDEKTWGIIFKPGNTFSKVTGILRGYARRFAHLYKALRYDNIFVHREAAPLGPPVFEWILCKVMRKRVIYDFDDAIWIPNISRSNRIAKWLKAFGKVGHICRWASVVTGGNDYLNAYARQQGARETVLLPTCVDTEHGHHHTKQHADHKPVVGWTGSHSTLVYLDEMIPLIRDLQEQYKFSFLVIADKKPELDLKDWQFVPWNAASEGTDLLRMDIGVMPLKPDAWTEGKCGFKLIQYLSCGIPAVADPVGVNQVIIDEGQNGFLCRTTEEWRNALTQLICDASLRERMGTRGREKIVAQYSIRSQAERFLSLIV